MMILTVKILTMMKRNFPEQSKEFTKNVQGTFSVNSASIQLIREEMKNKLEVQSQRTEANGTLVYLPVKVS